FKIAVGKNETTAASATTRAVPSGFSFNNRHNGNTNGSHISVSGRLLAFAPPSKATASNECHRSLARRERQARHAKSTAASAYTVGNASLPALPACNRNT